MLLLYQGGASVLSRLVDAARAWVGEGAESVKVLSVQPIIGRTPSSTRVWLSASGIANFDHILLYHKNEVSGYLFNKLIISFNVSIHTSPAHIVCMSLYTAMTTQIFNLSKTSISRSFWFVFINFYASCCNFSCPHFIYS